MIFLPLQKYSQWFHIPQNNKYSNELEMVENEDGFFEEYTYC